MSSTSVQVTAGKQQKSPLPLNTTLACYPNEKSSTTSMLTLSYALRPSVCCPPSKIAYTSPPSLTLNLCTHTHTYTLTDKVTDLPNNIFSESLCQCLPWRSDRAKLHSTDFAWHHYHTYYQPAARAAATALVVVVMVTGSFTQRATNSLRPFVRSLSLRCKQLADADVHH